MAGLYFSDLFAIEQLNYNLTTAHWVTLPTFLLSAVFVFFKIKISKNSFGNTISVQQFGSRSGLAVCKSDQQMTQVGRVNSALTHYAPIATSRLLFSSAEIFKKPLRQTVWTQIRLLL